MIYIIMCGGTYSEFDKHKALTEINGEKLIERTIRLLKKNGVKDIFITSHLTQFCQYGSLIYYKTDYTAPRQDGWWLDAFYPFFPADTEVTFLMGDVYYTEEGIRKIIEHKPYANTLYGTINRTIKNWEEPLAYKVYDYPVFLQGIADTKLKCRLGLCDRHPIIWELYRVLNDIPVNEHILKPETYVNVPNGGMDIDYPEEIVKLQEYYG